MRIIETVLTLAQLALTVPLAAYLFYRYSKTNDKSMLFGGFCGVVLCIFAAIRFFL